MGNSVDYEQFCGLWAILWITSNYVGYNTCDYYEDYTGLQSLAHPMGCSCVTGVLQALEQVPQEYTSY